MIRLPAVARCAPRARRWARHFGHQALEELLSAYAAPPNAIVSAYRRPSPLSDPVRYRKCPSCGEAMLRRNFRETSGVIVDVCAVDGIWLDHGELATLIEFAATGALAAAEGASRRLDAWGADLRGLGPRHYLGPLPVDAVAVRREPDARSDWRAMATEPAVLLKGPPREAPVGVVVNRNAGPAASTVWGSDALPYRGGLPLIPVSVKVVAA